MATMDRYAVIDNSTNICTNVFIGYANSWTAPISTTIIKSSAVNIGDSYNPTTGVMTRNGVLVEIANVVTLIGGKLGG